MTKATTLETFRITRPGPATVSLVDYSALNLGLMVEITPDGKATGQRQVPDLETGHQMLATIRAAQEDN